MAQQERMTNSVEVAAGTIGTALGRVAAQLDRWKQQRADIAAEVQDLVAHGTRLLAELGHGAPAGAPRARKGGRPKGYKTTPATRAKLRAAWARRKAAARTSAAAQARPVSPRTTSPIAKR